MLAIRTAIVFRLMGKWVHRLSNIDPATRSALCQNCGRVPIKRLSAKGWRCKVAWSADQKGRSGIGFGYRTGRCEICSKETSRLVRDHDHKNGHLRGWLCDRCNRYLGYFEKYSYAYTK